MSYLIGLYVYYHGNNLPLFGIEPGSDEDPLNGGLQHGDEIDIRQVNVDGLDIGMEAKEDLKKQKERAENTQNYEAILRQAIIDSQKRSQELARRGVVTESDYLNTPEHQIDGYEPNEGSIPLDFFNEINGF